MSQVALREILLVKAIEDGDPAGSLVPLADRERASRDALRSGGLATADVALNAGGAHVAEALGRRAHALIGPLLERHPALGDLLARSGWPRWAGFGVVAIAVIAGFGLSAMNGSRQINILALPFLGLLAWNVLVYAWLAGTAARRLAGAGEHASRPHGSALRGVGRRLGPLAARISQVDTVLGAAVRRFVADWSEAAAPWLAQQLRLWLHLGAACLALGLIGGLYQRGVGHHYVAGWESTWFGPSQVKWAIDHLFGAVASWSGIDLPATAADVARLEFQPDGSGGGSAAPWIHLIALCLGAIVVAPRLLLAAAAAVQGARWSASGRLPASLDAYARTCLGAAGQGLPVAVPVIPYGFEPPADARNRLDEALRGLFGRGAHCALQAGVAYGDEEAMAARVDAIAGDAPACVLLMNLAATPEDENHGIVIRSARERVRVQARPLPLRLLIDETAYRARFGAEAAPGGRLEERRRLWADFARANGLQPEFIGASAS
jgi:hypothetical protein